MGANMKTYLVKLLLQCMSYEKTFSRIVTARDEKAAGRVAMQAECHGTIEDGTAQ